MAERDDEQQDESLTEAELREPLVEEYAVPLVEAARAIRPVELSEESVFDKRGRATGVVMRPCVSRGARLRGLPPIYTPRMLGEHATVFTGWPMFIDHAPRAVREALAVHEERIREALPPALVRLVEAGTKRGVRDIGGQVLRTWYDPTYALDEDDEFGYQQGAVLAEYWATPYIRELAGENPHLFHTSISAWPTAGKPGTAPWDAKRKGMVVEGIRRKPEGSWDYVVRGGAGGHLKAEDEGEAEELMVSVAESVYASRGVQVDLEKTTGDKLRETLTEKFPKLAEELGIKAEKPDPKPASSAPAPAAGALTEADVTRMIEEASEGKPELTEDKVAEKITEQAEELIEERETQRGLSTLAAELIEAAEGLGPKWKGDLKARYAMRPSGPSVAILKVQERAEDENFDGDAEKALRERIEADIAHCRDLIAEAAGKPRPVQEGASAPKGKGGKAATPLWRERFVEMGMAESEEKAIEVFGGKVEEAKA